MTHPDEQAPRTHGGWEMGRSLALELDVAMYLVSGRLGVGELQPEFVALRQAVPESLRAELAVFAAPDEGWPTVFVRLANLAGVLLEDDYSTATLAMRSLTSETALAALQEQAAPLGIQGDPSLSASDALIDLSGRVAEHLMSAMDVGATELHRALVRNRRELTFTVQLLRDGDLHTGFWHWLDRFAYETYLPWRAGQEERMARLEQRGLAVLGAAEGHQPPPTHWLAPQSVVRLMPELEAAVDAGALTVVFWVDPFGLFDAGVFLPGRIVVSFSEPGQLYERFGAAADDIALRVSALADPTRLKILRLIRHFDADNTQLAQFMEVARPTVSVHARILQEAGLIESRREGRQARHTIQPAAIRQLFADLDSFLDLPPDEPPDE